MEVTSSKFDNRNLGILLGIIVPIAALAIQLFSKGYALDFFMNALKDNKPFASSVFTICLIANAITFGILVQFKKQRTAIGLFIPTAVIGIGLFVYKLFL